MLVGIGFDIHKHSENSDLYLAGLKLDGVGFEAHSDGDIILHALCDAKSSGNIRRSKTTFSGIS